MESNIIEQYQDIILYMSKEIIKKNNLIKDYELRLANIKNILDAKISKARYGEVNKNEKSDGDI